MNHTTKMTLVRVALVAVALVVAVITGASTLASESGPVDDAPSLASLRVDILPEYDRHAALVVYRAKLADTVVLPAKIALRLPAPVILPVAVMAVDGDGAETAIAHRIGTGTDGQLLTFTTNSRLFQLQFYDNLSGVEGDERSYDYVWHGDANVDVLIVVAHQPLTSARFATSPQGDTVTDSDGLTFSRLFFRNVAFGDEVGISLEYVKANDILTAVALRDREVSVPDVPALLYEQSTRWPPVLWGVALLSLVLLAVMMAVKRQLWRPADDTPLPPRRPSLLRQVLRMNDSEHMDNQH